MKKYKIGIFTSSFPIGSISPERSKRAISFLESMGHEVILGDLFTQNDCGYRSGTPKDRALEIHNLLNQDVDILMAAIGGSNTLSIMPYLDFELFKRKNPIVVGFSDTTSLLNALLAENEKAKVVYGPSLLPNYGEFEEISAKISWKNFLAALKPNFRLQSLDWTYGLPENWETFEKARLIYRNNEWKTLNVDENTPQIEGIIKGGNLPTLVRMLPTKYAPVFTSEDILFIEDSSKDFNHVEALFNILKLAGIFDKVKAIILGKYSNFNYDNQPKKPIDLLLEILDGQEIPILYNFDISHCKPMLSVPLNQKIKIDFEEKIIEVSSNLKK